MNVSYLLRCKRQNFNILFNSQSQENIDVVDEWEIPIENIAFGELLGEGAFGRVYRATLSEVSITHGQSNLAAKKLKDGGGEARKIRNVNESSTTVAVKTNQCMLAFLLI